MKLNASILIAPLVDIIVGKIIEAGSNKDPVKMVARAEELIAINGAFLKINSGDGTGLADLQAALDTKALSPGEALALQSLLASVSNQLALLSSIAGSMLVGQANTAILDSILATGTTAAEAYMAKYSAAASAATAAVVPAAEIAEPVA